MKAYYVVTVRKDDGEVDTVIPRIFETAARAQKQLLETFREFQQNGYIQTGQTIEGVIRSIQIRNKVTGVRLLILSELWEVVAGYA